MNEPNMCSVCNEKHWPHEKLRTIYIENGIGKKACPKCLSNYNSVSKKYTKNFFHKLKTM